MKHMAILILVALPCGTPLAALPAFAQDAAKTKPAPATPKKAAKVLPAAPPPTLADVPYGAHERHVLDFWKAESSDADAAGVRDPRRRLARRREGTREPVCGRRSMLKRESPSRPSTIG
jgi:hypothetical protein